MDWYCSSGRGLGLRKVHVVFEQDWRSVDCVQKRWSKAMVKGSWSVHVLVGAIGQLFAKTAAEAISSFGWPRCHVARGHLPPYGWTLLAIFFLQAPRLVEWKAEAYLQKCISSKIASLDFRYRLMVSSCLRQRKSCYHRWPERNLTEQWEVCMQGCTRHFGLPWLRQESWEWLRGKTLNVSQKCSCTRRSALKKTLPPECKERAEVQTSQAGVVSKMTSCK